METCFLAFSFHNNKVFLILDQCSLILVNFILTLENLAQESMTLWDSDPSENPVFPNSCVFQHIPTNYSILNFLQE